MAFAQVSWERRKFGQTMRRDRWWLMPLLVFLGLSAFVVYTTWAAFQGKNYYWGPYLSPFYSPEIFGASPHAWFGPMPAWWPAWLPFSPALLILPFPGLFRLTCYYYRGAYYKSFWADPPSCTVGEPRKHYLGERHFPLILFNVHRYFLYIAFLFLIILARDVWEAMWFPNPATGQTTFGIGLGTLIHELGVAPRIVTGHDFRGYSASVKTALISGLMAAAHDVAHGSPRPPVACPGKVRVACGRGLGRTHEPHGAGNWRGAGGGRG